MTQMRQKKQDLFADGEGDDQPGEDGHDQWKINQSYAKRFEHNKRREEFHRLKEKHPEVAARLAQQSVQGDEQDEEEDSTSEDISGDELIHPKESEELLRTLVKIRKKDPSIYDAQTQFYTDIPSDDEEETHLKRNRPSQKKKKDTLRSVIAKRAIAEGAEALAESSDEEERPQTYKEEQEQLRRDFLDAAGASDHGEDEENEEVMGGLSVRKGKNDLQNIEGYEKSKEATQNLLDEYFDNDDDLQEKDQKFLKDYIANEGWYSKDGEEANFEVSDGEDERHIEYAESFEAKYNFRYEEPNSAHIDTFPRTIESSVRKTESKRKRQRERKAERLAESRAKEVEEVKRLKNLKKAEIQEKISQIKSVAGVDSKLLEGIDLEEDYDPDKFNKQLEKVFNDEYYNEEDEALDETKSGSRVLDDLLQAEDDTIDEEAKALLQNGVEKEVEDVQKAINEYYKIDYEDKIGDLKCRFKYKGVTKNDYGIDVPTVLGASDKELNQVVGMKKIAPYRSEWKLAKKQKWGMKWSKANKKWEAELEWKGDKDRKEGKKKLSKDKKAASAPESTKEKPRNSRLDSYIPPTLHNKKLEKKATNPNPNEEKLYFNKGAKKRMKRAERRARKKIKV